MAERQRAPKQDKSKSKREKQTTPSAFEQASDGLEIDKLLHRARHQPDQLSHADVMHLQRSIGNTEVQRLFSRHQSQTPESSKNNTGTIIQRMLDKGVGYNPLNTLTELNDALRQLDPEITGISIDMLQTPGASLALVNMAIAQNFYQLFDGMKRADVLNQLKPDVANLVATRPASSYHYDTHGDKHFPGGPPGTKFTTNRQTVNPILEGLIAPYVGRIRRDANGTNQSYYFTTGAIAHSAGMDVTIQVDFDFAADSITYHGYPDANVIRHVFSRNKHGTAI